MTDIVYSVERLYHFNCLMCGGWFSVGDWKRTDEITCPHCGKKGGVSLREDWERWMEHLEESEREEYWDSFENEGE